MIMLNLSKYKCVLCFGILISSRFAASLSINVRRSNSNQEVNIDEEAMSDLLLSTPQLIKKYGYPVEEHIVQTKDDYLLTHFRIPHGHNDSTARERPPVILQHGLLSASDIWVLNGAEKSLGFILADAGYDVWLTNIRGNRHSRKHVTLSPNTAKFWDFSWHEMGYYDMPATIDYILLTTGQKSVYYMGHSMGTTIFFVMTSTKPEYNEKIRLAIALAPVAFLNPKHQLLRAVISSVNDIKSLLDGAGIWEILPYQRRFARILGGMCRKGTPTHELCVFVYFLAYGDDTSQLNKTQLPVYVSHLLAGTSTKTLVHFAQIIKSGRFQAYDFGSKNIEHYGQTTPPEYNLKKITTPVSLHFGEGDLIVNPEGVQRLSEQLPHLVATSRVQFPRFNHIDFIFANDVKPLLFDYIMNLLTVY